MYIRNYNRNKIINSLKNNKKWSNQFDFVKINLNIKPSWFGLPMLINKNFIGVKKKFLKH